MNRNKKTKNVKVNKEIENMEFTNSFDTLKAKDNNENVTNSKKKENDSFS
jgi:hypothetical protein